MMDADYQPSKETTNFARISRLVLDVIPDLLRDLLITQLSGSELSAVLADQKSKICSRLPPQIKKILYPGGGVYQGSVKDLDISLLYSLHRNLGNIPPHQNGWGNKPDIADRSLSANIERLREQRNVVFAHAPNTSLSDGDFRASWDIIRQSVEEIQNSELNTDRFVVAVDAMYALEMDHRMTNKYIEELLLDMKADMSTLREDVGVLRETVDTMATDSRQVRDPLRLTEQDLQRLASCFGSGWEMFVGQLGVGSEMVDQKKMENSTHVPSQVYSCLLVWFRKCPRPTITFFDQTLRNNLELCSVNMDKYETMKREIENR